jgi:general stress protein CsbA
MQTIFGLIFPIILLNYITDLHFAAYIGIFIMTNLIAWYISKTFLLTPMDVSIDNHIVKFKYLRNNLIEIKEIKETSLSNIIRFSDFNDRDLKFKLFFKNGGTYTLYRSNFWNRKDDFEDLIKDFKLIINDYNHNLDNNSDDNRFTTKKIQYGDDTYLIISVIFFIFSLIGLVILIESITNDKFEPKTLFGFVLMLILGGFFLYRHKQAIKTNDKIE